MDIYIVIPAHNEAEYIGQTLDSLARQSLLPKKIVVVDDHSSDGTAEIVKHHMQHFPSISLVKNNSGTTHHPGSKVIHAFNLGFKTLDGNYDIICKFDADLIFPENYLQRTAEHFQKNPRLGIFGGFCSIFQQGSWRLENLTGRDHVRGALKAYRKACFLQIGKLRPAMGWDTVDELLAQFSGWKVMTDPRLRVKHLKPTGKNYSSSARYKQGEAFYRLRYGFFLSSIASGKLAFKKKNFRFFLDALKGYFQAVKEKRPFLVSEEQGRFIRNLRWRNIRKKLF